MDPQPAQPTERAAISRQEWLDRCAARLVSRGGLTSEVAMPTAEAQLENLNDDLTENPEAAADDEMSCWTAD